MASAAAQVSPADATVAPARCKTVACEAPHATTSAASDRSGPPGDVPARAAAVTAGTAGCSAEARKVVRRVAVTTGTTRAGHREQREEQPQAGTKR